jgi:putative ABC transport system ATP-binding protein
MMAKVHNGGAAVSVSGLRHSYRSPVGPLPVLEEVSFEADEGDYCALMGPSGSGKSTLLGLLGGLDVIQGGSVRVGDVDVAALTGDDLAEYRRRTVGFVFQHFGLLESLTAAENVELAGTLAGDSPGVRRARAIELLASVGLQDRTRHRPGQLSGGERQRVAMARALANRPRLILADEPTGNLDEQSAAGVIDVLESLRERTGCTLIVVTHNHTLADRASRRFVLHGRKVVPA